MVSAQAVLKEAGSWVGVAMGTAGHRSLVDAYNRVRPLPVGYRLAYSDDWCDMFVTVVADRAGAAGLIGRECGVQRHLQIFKQKGIWLGRVHPRPGDIVIFDWAGSNAGWADHIGYVERFDGKWIHTIEGNSNGRVARNRFAWNDWRIAGYARPKYDKPGSIKPGLNQSAKAEDTIKNLDSLAKEVIQGKWGNGQERVNRLTQAGFDAKAVQARVNGLVGNKINSESRQYSRIDKL